MQRTIRGTPVAYEEIGSGTPVVVLHGVPADHRMAQHYLEPVFATMPGWRRIYPDLPGMGESPGLDAVRSSDDVVELVLDFVDALAPGEPFAVVGVSSGGYLARGVLARRAPRLAGLMLWTPVIELRDEDRRLPPRRVIASDPATVAAVTDDERLWLEVSVVQDPETLEAFRVAIKPGISTADFAFVRRVYSQELSAANLVLDAPFEGPSLVLSGRQDAWCGYLDAADVAESLPRATIAVLDRAGHALAAERPVIFRVLVADWLDRMALDAVAGSPASVDDSPPAA